METLRDMSQTNNEHEIYQLDNSLLTVICDAFDFTNPIIDPVYLSNSLTMTREKLNGVGLATNQVGINTSAVSVKGLDSCLFNPKIVSYGDEQIVLEEGCLSFPGMVVKIKRPKVIRVRFADAFGNITTQMFMGMTSRVIQHEIDHINGILFYNRANKFHKDQAFRKWKKYNESE